MKNTLRKVGLRHALSGLRYALTSQLNMQIHLGVAILVVLAGWYLEITKLDWLFVLMVIFMVLTLELVNTAIEAATDMITLKFSKHAKIAKDVAAAAVLVGSLGAVIIGVIIFLPYLSH